MQPFKHSKKTDGRKTYATRGVITTSLAAILISTGPSMAQTGVTFSIDFQGPTAGNLPGPFAGLADTFTGAAIDEGSILTPFFPGPVGPNPASPGALPTPGMMTSSMLFAGGSVPGGVGIVPGPVPGLELDALSYGHDNGTQLVFSVDEFAVGIPAAPAFPNVTSEGAFGSLEASADIFQYLGPVVATVPGPVWGNKAIIDGDGIAPWGGPGLGLLEPNPPAGGAPFDQGDNLDAVDVDTSLADLHGPVFFSMDSFFADPIEGAPANTGTAMSNGFVGGDVVVTPAIGSGLIGVYAPALTLGLDTFGSDTDDLDALILRDDGAVDAVGLPYFNPGKDFILFSVRRGSAIIGTPDSRLGLPIEEGDVLTIPATGSFVPQIYIPAESMGLMTARYNGAVGDELDALDLAVPEPASLALLGLGSLFIFNRGRKVGCTA